MSESRKLRRGIYLLPTLLTVGNLFCGYSSLVQSSRGAISQAAVLIVIAGVLDALDGRIARLTGTTSDFGIEFDSLADLVSFGLAPALLAYHWGLEPLGRLGWLVGFIFTVCAAMRLARFNIRAPSSERRHFAGLPSPMAAGAIASLAFAFPDLPQRGWMPVILAVYVAAVGLMMISRLRYRSFKEFDMMDRRSYTYVLPLAAIVVAIALRPHWTLLTCALLYLLSAPVTYAWTMVTRGGRPAVADPAEPEVLDGPIAR